MRRKGAKEQSQNETDALLIDHHTHAHDEGGIQVDKDISVDVEDGGMVFEKNDSETVADYKGQNHVTPGQYFNCR